MVLANKYFIQSHRLYLLSKYHPADYLSIQNNFSIVIVIGIGIQGVDERLSGIGHIV